MQRGIVKWFNNTMKYGFIISEEGKEVFVHFTEIEVEGYKTLKRGDVVSFEIEPTAKGVKAVKVVKLASIKQPHEPHNSRKHS